MTTLYHRLRHPFRRPTHYYTITESSQMPRQLERQKERERQRALDGVENDLDDVHARQRDGSTPDSLRVINDRGPYRGSFYPKDQLYFNSIMLATDVEPTSSRLPGGELRQETLRIPIWHSRKGKDRSLSPPPVPSEWLTASQNAEMLRRWEQRHGIEITSPSSWLPSRMQSSSRPLSPPREPITPGTQDWDEFMGFPLENSQYAYGGRSSKESAKAIAASKAPASSKPPAVTITRPTLVSHDMHTLPQAQSEVLLPLGKTSLETKLPDISLSEAESIPALTWTSALGNILHNEIGDPATRAIVTERLQRGSSKRRSGHEDMFPVALADANLVPNFSYPIASSAFYERLDGAQASLTRLSQEEEHKEGQQHEDLLRSATRPNHYLYATLDNTLYRHPTPPNWPLREQDEDHASLINGAPRGYFLRSSSDESNDASVNTRQHSPLPHNLIQEQVSSLLHSILTPSELKLHLRIIHETAGTGISPHEPAYNERSPAPLDVRRIQKLDTVLRGLQDRIMGLEEDLIPQLGTWLEQKINTISVQDVEISHLVDEIIELKHIVDFGNKILSLCRERELEVWHTLLDIRRKHQEKRGRVRIFSRVTRRSTSNDRAARALSLASAKKGLLRKEELHTLLLMAKQNVEIMGEDMKDMEERLQAYLARNDDNEGSERPAEGSWKDV